MLPAGPELLFIVGLALIIFGPKRLPEIGRAIGQGLRELRKASREITDAFDFREPFDSLSNAFDAPASDSLPEPDNQDDEPEDSGITDWSDEDSSPSVDSFDDSNAVDDAGIDEPKENEHDAANCVDPEWAGVVDYPPGSDTALRSEEASGDRQVDG